jgi:hypothetical protein
MDNSQERELEETENDILIDIRKIATDILRDCAPWLFNIRLNSVPAKKSFEQRRKEHDSNSFFKGQETDLKNQGVIDYRSPGFGTKTDKDN